MVDITAIEILLRKKVRKIIEDVKQDGDDALIRYTEKFDKVKLAPRQLRSFQKVKLMALIKTLILILFNA